MNPLINKLSFKNGLVIGGISTVLTLVFYFIDPVLQYTSLIILFLTLAIMIALLVILAIDVRKKVGGFWTFGQAFLSLFITSIVVIVISLVISFLILKLNPTLPQTINDAVASVTEQRFEKFGLDQDQIDKSMKMFTDGEFIATIQPTILNEVKGLGKALAIYAIIDLIIAACIRKNPPMLAAEALDEKIE